MKKKKLRLSIVIELRMWWAEWLLGKAFDVAPYPEGKKLIETVLGYFQAQPENAPPLPPISETAAWLKG